MDDEVIVLDAEVEVERKKKDEKVRYVKNWRGLCWLD